VPPGFAFAGWINFRGPIIKVEAELYAFRGLNCATNSMATSNCFPFGKRDPDKLASLGVEYCAKSTMDQIYGLPAAKL
jgi:hypothetical protein